MANLIHSPDFWVGLIIGCCLMTMGGLSFLFLIGVADRRAEELEGLQHDLAAVRFGGDLPAPAPAPEAANDATLDLRDAYRAPRTARSELRSGPR